MGLGIESGSDRILKLIGKNCTAETILNQLERLKNVGILPTVSIMVGQHTETKEDVMKSIELMIKSVRSNPNIQYAFSITTPFPGSPLYEHIFRERYLKDHQEFYDRYFSNQGDWFQVVNLSKMSDNEVIRMHKKIRKEYRREKINALGLTVFMIGSLQIVLGIIKRQFANKIFSLFPQNPFFIKITKAYNMIHDSVIQILENYRLKHQGIS